MKTKQEENRFETNEFPKMLNLFLAERVLRTWKEDFVDEDTGEVASIERNEIIMEKGTLLDHDKLSELKFFFDAGDIQTVHVSDVKRGCGRTLQSFSLWTIGIELNGKGKRVYLYGTSVEKVMETVTDYIEQTQEGVFKFKSIKTAKFSNIIKEDLEDIEENKDLKTYKFEVEVESTEDETEYRADYIMKCANVEDAKTKITEHIVSSRAKENDHSGFLLVVITAKVIPCDFIIDHEFCEHYMEE